MRETTTLNCSEPPAQRADGTPVELRQKGFALAALLYLDHGERAPDGDGRTAGTSTAKQANTNLRQTPHARLEARHG
jgi:hypothetical protein